LESVARRAGEYAERAHEALSDRFVDPPEGPIELLVTDHDDQSNGAQQRSPDGLYQSLWMAGSLPNGSSVTLVAESMDLLDVS
jgi:hypothetical protein